MIDSIQSILDLQLLAIEKSLLAIDSITFSQKRNTSKVEIAHLIALISNMLQEQIKSMVARIDNPRLLKSQTSTSDRSLDFYTGKYPNPHRKKFKKISSQLNPQRRWNTFFSEDESFKDYMDDPLQKMASLLYKARSDQFTSDAFDTWKRKTNLDTSDEVFGTKDKSPIRKVARKEIKNNIFNRQLSSRVSSPHTKEQSSQRYDLYSPLDDAPYYTEQRSPSDNESDYYQQEKYESGDDENRSQENYFSEDEGMLYNASDGKPVSIDEIRAPFTLLDNSSVQTIDKSLVNLTDSQNVYNAPGSSMHKSSIESNELDIMAKELEKFASYDLPFSGERARLSSGYQKAANNREEEASHRANFSSNLRTYRESQADSVSILRSRSFNEDDALGAAFELPP